MVKIWTELQLKLKDWEAADYNYDWLKNFGIIEHASSMNTLTTFTIWFMVCLVFTGCSPWEGYKETVRNGIKTIPQVQEFKKLFPGAPTDNFFIEYGVHKDEPVTWNTVVYFGGRYTLTYVVQVRVD